MESLPTRRKILFDRELASRYSYPKVVEATVKLLSWHQVTSQACFRWAPGRLCDGHQRPSGLEQSR
jgi:hypothetical protein